MKPKQSQHRLGLVLCRYRKHYDIEAVDGSDEGTVYQCVARGNLGTVVTGDQVYWQARDEQTGVIESAVPRSSLLQRPDNFGKLKPVAANINQMLIVIACEPEPQPNLIDRYLVAAELMNIDAVIILNKIDLINSRNQTQFHALLAGYQKLGYITVQIVSSRHQATQLAELPEIIADKTSIVVGQSGVGKSSLINTLLPDADLATGELSELTREGTHTTTLAKLFHLPGGGELIDSPGIRDFSLWHIDTQRLQQGFIEIAEAASQCRFRDCQHNSEPKCGVLAAVNINSISAERFASYQRIKQSMLDQQSRGLNCY